MTFRSGFPSIRLPRSADRELQDAINAIRQRLDQLDGAISGSKIGNGAPNLPGARQPGGTADVMSQLAALGARLSALESGGATQSYVFSEPVGQFEPVCMSSASTVVRARADDANRAFSVIGIALAAGSPGVESAVQRSGTVHIPGAGFTALRPVYVGAAGGLTQTPPAAEIMVGTAVSAEVLLVAPSSSALTSPPWGDVDDNMPVTYGMVRKGLRQQLSSARTYYVATTGSDTNDGLSAATAFKTIKKAATTVGSLDLNGKAVNIVVADGTYSEIVSLPGLVGGACTITGNATTPANCVTQGFFANSAACAWTVNGFSLTDGTPYYRIFASGSGVSITFSNVVFGATAGGVQVAVAAQAVITASGAYTIAGAAPIHAFCTAYGAYYAYGVAVTITGSPAFSNAFAYSEFMAIMRWNGATFTGAATGVRYRARTASMIGTGAAGPTYLPGDAAGSVDYNGQYI